MGRVWGGTSNELPASWNGQRKNFQERWREASSSSSNSEPTVTGAAQCDAER